MPGPRQTITNSLGASFVYIPAGRTVIGSAWEDQSRQYDEYPHPVRLSKGFWMSVTEVTQGQWKAVMGATRSHFSGDELPVESVSWVEAVAFCEKLSRKEGRVFRLPTEAEWEYACRAGGEENKGAAVGLEAAGWYAGNSDDQTHPVAAKKASLWGLFDMLGNVAEWCSDTYQAEYPREEVIDPAVRSERGAKVVRGGSWAGFARSCRCAARSSMPAAYQEKETGFRIIMEMPPGAP
jgi:formylglycine-generating enzyme required for sulfatase activity